MVEYEVNATSNILDLEILRLEDPDIIRRCIVQQNSSEFMFGNDKIDGLMLTRSGMRQYLSKNSAPTKYDVFDTTRANMILSGEKETTSPKSRVAYRANVLDVRISVSVSARRKC
jgi:hypothetical protein